MEAAQEHSSQPLGFISIDVFIHRPPGDPYNVATWPFPIIHERAANTPESAVVSATEYDDAFIERFVDAGERLAKRGAIGIITSCGFLAMPIDSIAYTCSRLSARLSIPIMTSALLQVPSLLALLPATRSVGILTFDDTRLGDAHLQKLGISPSRCHVRGAPPDGCLQGHIRRGQLYDHDTIAEELVNVARKLKRDQPDVALVCLECTNMPPFAEAIQKAIGLPVYDIHTVGCWFYNGLRSVRPARWGSIPEDLVEQRT
ncbi:hypothetical protein LIA77_02993 [Sarocladium implicatum]|nr:hypothetical protein LIA77_02993 [Sarocladium implicatum]